MGGYGAMRLALAHPDRYCSAVSHSGAVLFGTERQERLSAAEFTRVRGLKPDGSRHDLKHVARQAAKKGKLPKLRLDCGTEDHLIADNREFHQFLVKQKIAHEYEEFPGEHNWKYWDEHVREAIAFHARVVGIKPRAS